MRRLQLGSAGVCCLLILLLAACAPASTPAAPAAPGEAATAAAAPAPSGPELPADAAAEQVIRFLYERGNLLAPAPHRGGDIGREWSQLLYLTLVITDHDGNLLPGLAEGWEANDENTVFTFHLDPRAVWSDGTPVTAQDVKATWEWNATPSTLNTQINNVLGTVIGFSDIAADATEVSLPGVVVKDNMTLEVQTTRPDPLFPQRASLHWAGVTRVDKVREAGDEAETYWAGDPIVNGPFKIGKWDAATNEYDLVRNPTWWGDHQPIIERFEVRSILDPQTIIVAMENQEADAAYTQGSDSIAEVKQRMPETLIYKPVMFVIYWYWFVNKPLTDDVNLRAALLHAIDMNQVANVSTNGTFEAWTNFFHPSLPCWDPAIGQEYVEFNVDKAKEFLAKSKYGPTGADVPKILMSGRGISDVARAAQIIAEMWRVNLGIENVEIYLQALPPDEATKDQIGRLSMTAYVPDPINILTNLGYSGGLLPTIMGGYKNEELDAAILAADQMSRDDPQFCDMAIKAHNLLAADYMYIPYIAQDRFLFFQPWVKNVYVNNSETPYSFFIPPLTYVAER